MHRARVDPHKVSHVLREAIDGHLPFSQLLQNGPPRANQEAELVPEGGREREGRREGGREREGGKEGGREGGREGE